MDAEVCLEFYKIYLTTTTHLHMKDLLKVKCHPSMKNQLNHVGQKEFPTGSNLHL